MFPEEARKSLPVGSEGRRWWSVLVIRLNLAEVKVCCLLRPKLLDDEDVELLVASEELLL